MRSSYKPLGNYIEQVKTRNVGGHFNELRGVSIEKLFMSSVANIHGVDLSKYKVVKTGQFAFNPMHVGRDKVLPISLLASKEPVIVSPAYAVFRISDENLLPEYLMMWCSRSEFDRNAWFKTDGNVRGGLSWDDFCEITLPVPDLSEQQRIVSEYKAVTNRIRLNKHLIKRLEDTAQAIHKQWFTDFEFPMSLKYAESIGKPEIAGRPYKASGGEMRYDDQIRKDVPMQWDVIVLDDIAEIKAGGDKPKSFSSTKSGKYVIPIYSNGLVNDGLYGYTEKPVIEKRSITISARGSIGFSALRSLPFVPIVRLLVLTPNNPLLVGYLYQWAKTYDFADSGSVQSQLTIPQISNIAVLVPANEILAKYEEVTAATISFVESIKQENEKLKDLGNVVLARMSLLSLEKVEALV